VPSRGQITALSDFFRSGPFFRLASVVKRSTKLGTDEWTHYQVAGAMLMQLFANVLRQVPATSVSVVFEASQRGDRLAQEFFPLVNITKNGQHLPAQWGSIAKAKMEPGLEVADYVMHAAGGQVTARESGKANWRKDFACVFQEVDDSLSHFAEISKFDLQRNPNGTIPGVLLNPPSVVVDD
jgi:hypothetical protein